MNLICLIIGSVSAVIFVVLMFRGAIYDDHLDNDVLDFDTYPGKAFYSVGLWLEHTSFCKVPISIKDFLLKDTEVYYEKELGMYYVHIIWAQIISYVFLTESMIFLIAGLVNEKNCVYVIMIGELLVVVLCYYFLMRIHGRVQERKEACETEFPNAISKLALIVNSGMTITEAWKYVADGKKGIFYELMQEASEAMRNGIPAADAIIEFGRRCNSDEIRKFSIAINVSIEEGPKELRSFLIDKTTELWETKRQRLLTGYLTYMTSNRSTYTGNNLLGKPFNTRKQETTNRNGTGIGLIDSFTELISMAKDGGKGNTKKCFVGAETEYLINGSKNEIANQSAVFLYLYAIRLIANIYTVFSNPEVAEIAAASTLAAPVIYMLYIFIEPLSDCVLLVNNGKTDFIKSTPNLVVSGFGSYVSDILLLELSDAEITSANEKLITALGANEDYAKKHTEIHGTDWSSAGGGENKKRSFGFDYTNYMILMLSFTSSDNLIKRFSDIVEMEATENLSNVVNTSGQFNLNYSYTYVRAKANFSTNNFITISGNNKLRMKEVTVYKGY